MEYTTRLNLHSNHELYGIFITQKFATYDGKNCGTQLNRNDNIHDTVRIGLLVIKYDQSQYLT
jgi:hypothetical protein